MPEEGGHQRQQGAEAEQVGGQNRHPIRRPSPFKQATPDGRDRDPIGHNAQHDQDHDQRPAEPGLAVLQCGVEEDQSDDGAEQEVEDEQLFPVLAQGVQSFGEVRQQEAAFEQNKQGDEQAGDQWQDLLQGIGLPEPDVVGEDQGARPAPTHQVHRDGNGIDFQHFGHHGRESREQSARGHDERRVDEHLQSVSEKSHPRGSRPPAPDGAGDAQHEEGRMEQHEVPGLQAQFGLPDGPGIVPGFREAELEAGRPILEEMVEGHHDEGHADREAHAREHGTSVRGGGGPHVPAHQRQGGQQAKPRKGPRRVESAIPPVLHPERQRDERANEERKGERQGRAGLSGKIDSVGGQAGRPDGAGFGRQPAGVHPVRKCLRLGPIQGFPFFPIRRCHGQKFGRKGGVLTP